MSDRLFSIFLLLFFIKYLKAALLDINVICNSITASQILNDTNRNINYSCPTCDPSCDDKLNDGWYAFGVNAILPISCPIVDSCMSESPFWVPYNQFQPNATSPEVKLIKLCMSRSTTGNDLNCYYSCNLFIETGYCSNINMVVYKLGRVNYCNLQYCYDIKIPCGPNEVSPTGFQPCEPYFPFQLLTNATTTVVTSDNDPLFSNIPGTSAKCFITCPTNISCENVYGDVDWYIKANATSFKRTSLLYDRSNNNLYGYIEQNDLLSVINNNVYCQISPRINGTITARYINTTDYYFGMYLNLTYKDSLSYVYNAFQAQTINLLLGEIDNNTARLEVYCTIPILCLNSVSSCSLPISLEIQGDYGSDLVRTLNCNSLNCDGCMKNLKNQTIPNPNNIASWDIITTVEPLNVQVQSTATIQFQVIKSITVIGSYWNKIQLPKVQITYKPRNQQVKFARSYNDPHMLTFDQTPFEFQNHGGEYLMMENKKTLLRVHAIASSCWNWIFCNDRLYIQSVDDVVIHDIATPDVLFYIDLSTQPITKIQVPFDANNNAVLFKKFGVQITRYSGYFQIITHFSTLIRVYWYGGNFEIYPSKMDLYNVFGLLGNYDKNPNNDLRELEIGIVSDDESFFQAYNVIANGRPLMSNNQFYNVSSSDINSAKNLTQYCVCTNTTGQLNVLCPLGLTQIGQKIFSRPRSLQSQLTFTDAKRITKLIENFGAEKEFRIRQHHMQRVKRSAIDLCNEVLNIETFRNCSSQNLINLTAVLQTCHFDFNATGVDWSDYYYQSVIGSLKTLLLGDRNNFIPTVNGQSIPQISLLQNLCLNNCTGHGKCLNGTCACDDQFSGDDCSIDISIPPKIYNSTLPKDLCDSIFNDCDQVLLLLNRTSSNLTLNYDILKQSNGELKYVENGTSDVLFWSSHLIHARLYNYTQNEIGLSVIFYTITVSDCNCSRSEPFHYAIYKSACHECIDAQNCTVKSGTCDIKNNCYKNGDKNPSNENEICNYTLNKFTWSQKSVVAFTSTAASETMTPGIIAAIVVSCIAGVLIVVVGAVIIVLKRKGRL